MRQEALGPVFDPGVIEQAFRAAHYQRQQAPMTAQQQYALMRAQQMDALNRPGWLYASLNPIFGGPR